MSQMLILPWETFWINEALSPGNTHVELIPLMDFSKDIFGVNVGGTNILFTPYLLNKCENFSSVDFPIRNSK